MGEGKQRAGRTITASVRDQARAVGQRWKVASPFDRARVLIVAVYSVIFLALLGFIIGTGESESSFRASAWYQALDDEYHIRIENRSSDRWEGIRLTLNRRYALGFEEVLLPAESRTVRIDRFRIPGCVEEKNKEKKKRRKKRRRKKSHVATRSACAPPRGEAPRELGVQWEEGGASWPFPANLQGARTAGEKP